MNAFHISYLRISYPRILVGRQEGLQEASSVNIPSCPGVTWVYNIRVFLVFK